MKRAILLAGFCYILASCGGNSNESTQTQEVQEESATSSTTTTASAITPEKAAELLNKSGCLTCHKEQEKLIGPAYVDVAAKYEATEENISMLANSVMKGSSGKWGEIPMPPNAVSEEDAKALVSYILSLKK